MKSFHLRLVLGATLLLSAALASLFGELWALVPLCLLSVVGWARHLPTHRRTPGSLFRFGTLVLAQFGWAMVLGACIDVAILYNTNWRPSFHVAVFSPFIIPCFYLIGVKPSSRAGKPLSSRAFRVLLDLPFFAVVMFYHFVWGHKLNDLATRIEDDIYLGSLPFASDVAVLKHLGITHVINMCDEWSGPVDEYREAGIQQLRLRTTDGFPPSIPSLITGASWVEKIQEDALQEAKRQGKAEPDKPVRVFVHCRFGMGRSAAMVLALLLARGRDVNEAASAMRVARPEAIVDVHRGARFWSAWAQHVSSEDLGEVREREF